MSRRVLKGSRVGSDLSFSTPLEALWYIKRNQNEFYRKVRSIPYNVPYVGSARSLIEDLRYREPRYILEHMRNVSSIIGALAVVGVTVGVGAGVMGAGALLGGGATMGTAGDRDWETLRICSKI